MNRSALRAFLRTRIADKRSTVFFDADLNVELYLAAKRIYAKIDRWSHDWAHTGSTATISIVKTDTQYSLPTDLLRIRFINRTDNDLSIPCPLISAAQAQMFAAKNVLYGNGGGPLLWRYQDTINTVADLQASLTLTVYYTAQLADVSGDTVAWDEIPSQHHELIALEAAPECLGVDSSNQTGLQKAIEARDRGYEELMRDVRYSREPQFVSQDRGRADGSFEN